MSIIVMGLAGAVGAVTRFLVDKAVSRFVHIAGFGIAVVNVLGCFLMGMCVAAGHGGNLAVTVGFLGGFTTFSTAMIDAVTYLEKGQVWRGIALLLGVFTLSLLSLGTGTWVGGLVG